jgi:hypothetical protein
MVMSTVLVHESGLGSLALATVWGLELRLDVTSGLDWLASVEEPPAAVRDLELR